MYRCDSGSHRPKTFNVIAMECMQVANKLVRKLQRLKYSGKRQPWKSIRQALKSVWSKNEIDALESRLNSYRQQLILQGVFAPDKHVEYASFDKRLDSLNDSNSQVLSQLAVLAKALAGVQEMQKHVSSSPTAVSIPKDPQHCGNGNATDSSGDTLQNNATVPTSKQLDTLQAKIDQLHKAVTGQPEMIALLLAKKTTVSQKGPQVREELYEDKDDQMFTSHEEASQLSTSLNDLYQFALKTRTAFLSEHAQLMIKSLDKILEAVERASSVSQLNHTSRKRRRSRSLDEDVGAKQQKVRAIKRIRGLLNSSQSMSVNQPGKT